MIEIIKKTKSNEQYVHVSIEHRTPTTTIVHVIVVVVVVKVVVSCLKSAHASEAVREPREPRVVGIITPPDKNGTNLIKIILKD